jgi:2,3-bisphosphoglycerate-independent phosphoglycerate mutase
LVGAAVTDSALYRGLARILGMNLVDLSYDANDPAADMARRLKKAGDLLAAGADFVHVHVKATDAAGHAKQPTLKRDVIASIDAGLEGLLTLATQAIVAVTGDHATPSVGSLLHSGDPTPFVVAGPGVGADAVKSFGERYATQGVCGRLAANDVMPLLVGLANRPFFYDHRPGPWRSIALPNHPEPMPLDTAKE